MAQGGWARRGREHPLFSMFWQQSWPCKVQRAGEQVLRLISKWGCCLDLKMRFSVQRVSFQEEKWLLTCKSIFSFSIKAGAISGSSGESEGLLSSRNILLFNAVSYGK